MIRRFTVVLPFLFLFVSCTKVPAPLPAGKSGAVVGTAVAASGAGAVTGTPAPVYPANLFAVLKAGESPLWFELGEDGPRLIDYPGEAELSPFTPWPLTRHIRGLLAYGEDLVAGVNRDGLLLLRPWTGSGEGEGGLALYRIADRQNWESYTLGSLFFYGESPAVLVYRDDRFSDPAVSAPSPAVWALKDDLTGFEGLELPCLGIIPFAKGWEADVLRFGGDGRWYYRGIFRRPDGQDIRYYRTADPGQEGAEISVGAFRDAARPERPGAAPPLLQQILEKAAALGGAGIGVLSPDFTGQRNFAAAINPSHAGSAAENAGEEIGAPLFGFYRGGNGVEAGIGGAGLLTGPVALAVFPDGSGILGRESGIQPFSLPPLPDGFVYTGIGMAGDTIFAAWEEQQEWNIGASGFMVIKLSNES
jgi:hypothetical protein